MLVAIARFPEVPTDRQGECQAWFAWSNDQLRTTDGAYVALVEHHSAETFAAMHATDQTTRVQARLAEIVADRPQPAKKVSACVELSG